MECDCWTENRGYKYGRKAVKKIALHRLKKMPGHSPKAPAKLERFQKLKNATYVCLKAQAREHTHTHFDF